LDKDLNLILELPDETELFSKHQANYLSKTIDLDLYTKNILFRYLNMISPVFTFFIYNVDKNIRKYSRGKSGKHTFI
jgi:hypothetical protein